MATPFPRPAWHAISFSFSPAPAILPLALFPAPSGPAGNIIRARAAAVGAPPVHALCILLQQAGLEAALRFLIIAVDIHENLRGAAIVGDMDGGHTHESDAGIGQFSFHQRFNFLAQGLA